MRIGIVTQSYLPIHGGVAQHVHHLAMELRKRGHVVWVITAYFNRGDEHFKEGVFRIGHDVTLPMSGAFVNVTIGSQLGQQLRSIEERERFDVVHIHGPLEPFLPLLALSNLQAPKVGTFHTYRKGSFLYSLFQGFLERYASQLAARIAVSEAARDFVSRYFPGDYHIIPNGVDTNRFQPGLDSLPAYAHKDDTILFVGRMDPRKGLRYLLQAFPQVVRVRPKTRLVIVGGGMLAGYYKGFLTPEIVKKVHFEGYASADELPRYYANATVFCSPATNFESFGIVLLEALACGVPVVAFANPGYRALLADGQGSRLVPNRDVQALAQTLLEVLENPQQRRLMAQAGRKKSLEYSWPKVAEEVEKVYQSVLQSRVRKRKPDLTMEKPTV